MCIQNVSLLAISEEMAYLLIGFGHRTWLRGKTSSSCESTLNIEQALCYLLGSVFVSIMCNCYQVLNVTECSLRESSSPIFVCPSL